MKGDRHVGGLWCHEVLALLSDYLDDGLAPEARSDVEAHLEHCDVCASFGDRVGAVVTAVRTQLQPAPPPAPDLVARVLAVPDEEGPAEG